MALPLAAAGLVARLAADRPSPPPCLAGSVEADFTNCEVTR
jgi:hypothetical protein